MCPSLFYIHHFMELLPFKSQFRRWFTLNKIIMSLLNTHMSPHCVFSCSISCCYWSRSLWAADWLSDFLLVYQRLLTPRWSASETLFCRSLEHKEWWNIVRTKNPIYLPVRMLWKAVSTFVESKADVSMKLKVFFSANPLASSVGTARKCLKSDLLPTYSSIINI